MKARTSVRMASDDPLLTRALQHLRGGGVVIAATESGYALFASARNPVAVRRVCEIKGRGDAHPLPLVIADEAGLLEVAQPPGPTTTRIMECFWPGPLTVVCPANDGVPGEITAGTGTVGVRIPPHPVAAALTLGAGPLTATSANLTGGPIARSVEALHPSVLANDVVVLDGGQIEPALPSTVVRLDGDRFEILREGPVTRDQIAALL